MTPCRRSPNVMVSGIVLVLLATWSRAAETDVVRAYSIEAQPLTSALLEFSRQSGYSVGFVESLTTGKTSNAVHGYYRAQTALRLLLKDSGLSFERLDDETVAVVRQPVAEENAAPAAHAGDSRLPPGGPANPPSSSESHARLSYGSQVDEVVVLGTHIAGAPIRESVPATIWGAERMQARAAVDAGDLFRSLPFAGAVSFNGVDTFFAGVNSARGDISSINLRELGTGNTLVLLNGRRMVMHPGVQTEGRVPAMTANMNVLPVSSLARIEILRDGASAIYGADAVAGVVNNVLRSDHDRVELTAMTGVADGTGMSETEIDLRAGFTTADERSHVQLIAAFAHRSGVHASEHWFSRSSNLQPLLAGTEHENNSNFNNTSINGAWGQFELPMPVTQNGIPLTSSAGIFHLQPASFAGCITSISDQLCLDDGFIDMELYGDSNTGRQLIPDLERTTVILTGDHALTQNVEAYGELIWYEADSTRIAGAIGTLSSTPITIPAWNYWNPFGPLTFSDGRTNPNRLPDIDAPAEGLAITLNSSFFGSGLAIVDAGPRLIGIENSSYRVLAGLRGEHAGWDWDGALLRTRAVTHDLTRNRVSNTLFQRALALETPQAYNPFNGSAGPNPGSVIDGNPNPPDIVQQFQVDVSRKNAIELTMADLRLSVPDIATLRGHDVAAAVGIEFRHEKFLEDRDERFDGSTTFTDIVTGETFDSDVMGSSVTLDSAGSRNVSSLFSEVAVPVIRPTDDIRMAESFDVQLAARYENYSDVGSSFQPRFAFSWRPAGPILLRGSWSRGVRVPNLPQLNAGETRRVLYATDWYRCAALLNRGEIASLGNCGPAGRVLVESLRTGSQLLQPEDYESVSVGIVVTPPVDTEFHVSFDFWKIEQDGIVGLFGAENQVAVDYAERLTGRSSANVVRAPLSQADIDLYAGSGLAPAGQVTQIRDFYVNLDRRISSGVDLSLSWLFDEWRHGVFRFDVDATRLISADQSLPAAAVSINALNEPAIAVVGGGNLLRRDARPLWRVAADLQFEHERWRGGLSGHYVSRFFDTSAVNDAGGGNFVVEPMLTIDAYWELATSLLGDTIKSVRVGARNLLDEDPPLADESFGFNAAMHSSHGRFWYVKVGAAFR